MLIHIDKRGSWQFYPYIIQAYFIGTEQSASANEIALKNMAQSVWCVCVLALFEGNLVKSDAIWAW